MSLIALTIDSMTSPANVSGILDDTEELKGILMGRAFLTADPVSLETRQVKLNFDLIVIPTDAGQDLISKIIANEIQECNLGEPQVCWRMDIDQVGQTKFIKLETD